MFKIHKIVVCKNTYQSKLYLSSLPKEWTVSFSNFTAQKPNHKIFCCTPDYLDRIKGVEVNAFEFLTNEISSKDFDFIMSRLRLKP